MEPTGRPFPGNRRHPKGAQTTGPLYCRKWAATWADRSAVFETGPRVSGCAVEHRSELEGAQKRPINQWV